MTATSHDPRCYVTLELSQAKWLVGALLPGRAKIILHTVRGGDAASRRAFFRRPPKQKGPGSAGPLSPHSRGNYWPKRLLNMTFTRPRITSDEASSSS